MVVVIVATLAGLVAVLVALSQDGRAPATGPPARAWAPLPSPDEVAGLRLPLAAVGYDRAVVRSTLDLLAQAYADLLAVAPPEVVERARSRAAARQGQASAVDPGTPGTAAVPAVVGSPDEAPAPDAGTAREALRAAAALGLLAVRRRRTAGSTDTERQPPSAGVASAVHPSAQPARVHR